MVCRHLDRKGVHAPAICRKSTLPCKLISSRPCLARAEEMVQCSSESARRHAATKKFHSHLLLPFSLPSFVTRFDAPPFHRAPLSTESMAALASSLSCVSAVRGVRVVPRARVAPISRRPGFVVNAMGPEMKGAIDKLLSSNKVVVFMKGNKDAPKCGFSNTVVQVFKSMDVPFETVDILADDGLRAGMKVYSDWPTFPQVYIDGEFFGGCDIVVDTYKDGTLKETVDVAMLA